MNPSPRRVGLRACPRTTLRGVLIAAAVLLGGVTAAADPSELAPEIGYNYGEVETPRWLSLGGALRAFGNPTDGLFTNPANMATARVYHVGAMAAIWPEAQRQSYGLSAVDSIVSSSRLAGGIGGSWNFQDRDGIDRESKDLRFGFAFPFGDQFFLGLGGRYMWLAQDGEGPLGDSAASGGLPDENVVQSMSFDAGATLRPTPNFALALVGTNLTNPDNGFQPTTLGGGIGVGSPEFTVEFDAVGDFTSWGESTARVMSGAELLVADRFPLRLGYRWDGGADSHALSGGVGYLDRAFSAELGFRRTVSGEPATTISFGFKYHLESAGLTPDPGDTF